MASEILELQGFRNSGFYGFWRFKTGCIRYSPIVNCSSGSNSTTCKQARLTIA